MDERLGAAGLPHLSRPMWLEIDAQALAGNVAAIRRQVGRQTAVWPVVKADGYGHGLEVAARAFLAGGADGVCPKASEETPIAVLTSTPVVTRRMDRIWSIWVFMTCDLGVAERPRWADRRESADAGETESLQPAARS